MQRLEIKHGMSIYMSNNSVYPLFTLYTIGNPPDVDCLVYWDNELLIALASGQTFYNGID